MSLKISKPSGMSQEVFARFAKVVDVLLTDDLYILALDVEALDMEVERLTAEVLDMEVERLTAENIALKDAQADAEAEVEARGRAVLHPSTTSRNELAGMATTCSTRYLRRKLLDISNAESTGLYEQAVCFAAADRLGVDVFPSLRSLRQRGVSKGELVGELYPAGIDGVNAVDCAIPQPWVNRVSAFVDQELGDELSHAVEESGGVAAQFCTVYFETGRVRVLPVTRTGIEVMSALADRAIE